MEQHKKKPLDGVKVADIFLTNLRKSTKKKLGIDYAALSKINPRFIHANVSGFGPEGPMADMDAFDPLGQAWSGMTFITGTDHPESKYWGTFCRVTGQSTLLHDPPYTDDEGQPVKSAELIEIFDTVFEARTSLEWMEILSRAELIFCPIQKITDVRSDPQAIANNYVTAFKHKTLGDIQIPGYPVHFSACTAGPHADAPGLGEHTDETLADIGYAPEEIERFRKEEIVR